MAMRTKLGAALLVSALCLIALSIYRLVRFRAVPPAKPAPIGEATFVDERQCAKCHASEYDGWLGSQHDLAMQEANEKTVLGDFSDTRFKYNGVETGFYRKGGKYWTRTDGPDGKVAEFEIAFTIGIAPLQQYLIALPKGRLQALSIAWDVEKKRWFHLYPNEAIDANDELHWTKPAHNWNHMCAECHTTDLHKNYDLKTQSYHTSFARMDVGCQSCHGPASQHITWANHTTPRELKTRLDKDHGIVGMLRSQSSRQEVEACARCHSRRETFWHEYRHGAPLLDHHLPSLLDEELYQVDGQILGEVYEHGSFIQSKMASRGLRCTDCHDPHRGKTRSVGDALCVTRHNPNGPVARKHVITSGLKRKDYTSTSHHFHKPGTPGSRCVDCHMPARTYMVVDPRRDHSFQIPRPDLSLSLGTSNACNNCHRDKSAAWSVAAVRRWYGSQLSQRSHPGQALHAARQGAPGAMAQLSRVAVDPSQNEMVRATALQLLSGYPSDLTMKTIASALHDADPLVRHAAAQAAEGVSPSQRVDAIGPLLEDPIRAVRIEAARLLASVTADELGRLRQKAFDTAIKEYAAAQRLNLDRAESHLNLGNLYVTQRQDGAALAHYRRAINQQPQFVPAYVNLADLQSKSSEALAESTLRRGLGANQQSAALRHALGLCLARQGRSQEAVAELARAANLAPRDAHFAYVYGVALNDTGDTKRAVQVLANALLYQPYNRPILQALVDYSLKLGKTDVASQYAKRLEQLHANP